MDRNHAENEFCEKCFEPVFSDWTKRIIEQYANERESIKMLILTQSRGFLATLAELQQQIDCQVSTLTFSFLWTSLLQGEPAILIEAYEDIPFVSDPILSEKIPAPWLFWGWTDFIKALEEKCGKLALSTYIRLPQIRAKALSAAQEILITYSMILKDHFRQLPQTPEWRAIQKQLFFFVTAGEYMERQLPLLGERPEVDLVYLEKGSDVRFAKFQGLVFKGQNFSELLLSDTCFLQCTFQDVTFEQCGLCDAVFIDCTFENCTLSHLSIMGTNFYSNRFTNVTLQDVWSSTGQSNEKNDCISCGRTLFSDCLLEYIYFDHSELNKVKIIRCQFIHINSNNSDLCSALMEQVKDGE